MKILNIKNCLLVVACITAPIAPVMAQEIVVAASDISIYEEGDASVNLGNRVWSWSAADDSSIPKQFKTHFKTYCEVKPVDGGKEFLVAASEGGFAIVDRETKKARKWGICGQELFTIEKISDDVIAFSGRDHKSRSGCVFIVDLKNREKTAGRFVFDKPRGLYWDEEKSYLWVLDAGALNGCKFKRESDGTFSLNRAKIISLVDRDTGLGCDLRPLPKYTNGVLTASMKGAVRLFDLKKMYWCKNSTTIPVDHVNSYDTNVDGKAFFVRFPKDASGSDVLEKRQWGRRFIPFKKIKGAAVRRARWVQ
ncbi:MAG: hypothetical protein IKL02_07960 [Kiritimatiellae bacterium]|nr:hypothetical protein [Kiritimatiellia bacterium]